MAHLRRSAKNLAMLQMRPIALTLIAIFARHSSPLLARGSAILALVCLIIPFVMAMRRPKSPTGVKTWRGKDMTYGEDYESPIDSIKRWWKSRH